MLQVYSDDSGKHDPKIFCAGSLCSTAERWAHLCDEWAAELARHPKIDYFKAREAAALEDQFYGMSAPERDQKVAALIQIINRHCEYMQYTVTDTPTHKDVGSKISISLGSPAFHAFHEVMRSVLVVEGTGQRGR